MDKHLANRGDFWDDMGDLRKKMMEVFSLAPFQTGRMAREMGMGQWYPAVDVSETRAEIVVAAELPGMTEDDIQLDVSSDLVEISGERKEAKDIEDKEAGFIHRERSLGKFYRSVPLPSEIDPERAQAVFKNGVLKITLPRTAPQGKGKHIPVEKG
ncbi:MAG TPA: Hsp20/alpha crystallin family protein [Candidatus Omnitrophota bacterium]|nr:Hsp20/alpha crystallin family protein [Candidatus Omnitrophota bacterium]